LAFAGALAGLAGLATSQGFVWAFSGESPLVAVALAVRDFTPGSLAVRLVEIVRHLDKPLLIAGTAVIFLLICALAGVLSRRSTLLTDGIFFGLAVLGLLAELRLDGAGLDAGIAVVVGLVTWLVCFRILSGPLLADSRGSSAGAASEPVVGGEDGGRSARPDRRQLLLRSGGVALGAVAAAALGRLAGRGREQVEQARRLLRLPVSAGRVPSGVDAGVEGIAPWRTPNARFYRIDTAFSPPAIKPNDWSVRIHGMVDREITLSYAELVDRQLTETWVTLCCVSNVVGGDLIGNAYWSGVLVRDLLAEAGVHPGADAVLQTSKDGWTCGTPLTALTDDRNAMLAVAMNGEPLPLEHGFPVRMVVPGLYGYVSATKWLVDLEVTRFDRFSAYWTERGWGAKGPVKTESRIDVPRGGAAVPSGPLAVGGSAWAQHTGIAKVQYQLDGGPWEQAELGSVPNQDTWVQWSGRLEVSAGKHTLAVRATDRTGETQTAVRSGVLPDGATGWHTIDFEAEG
jgi:DMSO/TMAO reductase YedYZ molybdopterin-dependent catalytic subunit